MIKPTSSKGTQQKWSSNGYFYKQDNYGGEAEVEFLVSQFLSLQGFSDFVYYEKVDTSICRSLNFVPRNGEFVTFYRYLQNKGVSETEIEAISKLDPSQQLSYIYKHLMDLGFTKDYLDYQFSRMFEIDYLVLNVDRHWNNFGVLVDGQGNVSLLTLFDFGYSLGVLYQELPRHVLVRKSKAATVSRSFKKQVSLLPRFNFNIPTNFLTFLENRGTREALLFRHRIKTLYNL